MDNRIFFPQQPIATVKRNTGKQEPIISSQNKTASFDQLLNQELAGVKFSNHALQRLQHRNIKLSQEELTKIGKAVDQAAQKGAKESLIVMNSLALVVSVKNKTVITAMDGASMKDNVFTNIDSAVII